MHSNKRAHPLTFTRPTAARAWALAASMAVAVAWPVPAAHAASSTPANAEEWAKGRILVMPRAGLSQSALARMLSVHGGKGKKIGGSNLYIVELPPTASEKAVVERLAHHPHLKFAELDHRHPPVLIPNDPYYGSAWHLPKIGAPLAWDGSQGAGVTIAILDSGVDASHPDLAGRTVPGWNFYDNNSNTADVYGHGTKTAGAAAAAGDNGVGVASVAGLSTIMPIRVTDLSGMGYTSMIASGLVHAADHGVRVANVSFAYLPKLSAVVNASQYMKDKGGLVVVSAGNYGIDENYTPTTAMIPVSATDGNDIKTGWSSYGNYVAMSAPGVGIWTTTRGGGYGAPSGTSFSSPVTAGVVALMMAANPALSSRQIESLLFSSAVDLGSAGRDPYYGHGRVDAAAAVQAALNATATIDTQAPSVSIVSPTGGATVSGWVPVDVTASDNVGVTRIELRVNGSTVATDTSTPYAFSWDSTTAPNGMVSLVAHAFDAAGNSKASTAVSVNVANGTVAADTTPPVVRITSPADGSRVGAKVTVSVSASDDNGAAGITQSLYIDGALKATATGAALSYTWNTRKVAAGTHTIKAVAKDAAGNSSSVSVQVSR